MGHRKAEHGPHIQIPDGWGPGKEIWWIHLLQQNDWENEHGRVTQDRGQEREIALWSKIIKFLREEIIQSGLVNEEEYSQLEAYTYRLFERGTLEAEKRGLILVDTKYEFGNSKGTIYLIDEIHTPDSSRYFYADGYQERQEKGEKQKQLSKEFVRQWLIENDFQGKEGQTVPEMTDEVVNSISDRYLELFKNLTGEELLIEVGPIEERIKQNIEQNLSIKEE